MLRIISGQCTADRVCLAHHPFSLAVSAFIPFLLFFTDNSSLAYVVYSCCWAGWSMGTVGGVGGGLGLVVLKARCSATGER